MVDYVLAAPQHNSSIFTMFHCFFLSFNMFLSIYFIFYDRITSTAENRSVCVSFCASMSPLSVVFHSRVLIDCDLVRTQLWPH